MLRLYLQLKAEIKYNKKVKKYYKTLNFNLMGYI